MELDDAIRSLGYTNVPVKLHHEVTATLKVHVTEVIVRLRRGTMSESIDWTRRATIHNQEAEQSDALEHSTF